MGTAYLGSESGYIIWQGVGDYFFGKGTDGKIYEADVPPLATHTTTQLTGNTTADQEISTNQAGQAVWSRFDGQDWEIFHRSASGVITKVTNNTYDDMCPRLNANGRHPVVRVAIIVSPKKKSPRSPVNGVRGGYFIDDLLH